MASSRDEILRTIRTRTVPTAPLPEPFSAGIRYEDPLKQFCEALAFVGGASIIVRHLAAADQELRKIPVLANAKKVCSLVPGLGQSNVSLDSIDDPHLLEDVDVAILPGKFGVAENGAIWLPTASLRQRVLPFITQHLVLVIPAAELVHNMHQAYESGFNSRERVSRVHFGAVQNRRH
ncbi:MAG: LUD domain-containing protein [Planctomycetales bacterium]